MIKLLCNKIDTLGKPTSKSTGRFPSNLLGRFEICRQVPSEVGEADRGWWWLVYRQMPDSNQVMEAVLPAGVIFRESCENAYNVQ